MCAGITAHIFHFASFVPLLSLVSDSYIIGNSLKKIASCMKSGGKAVPAIGVNTRAGRMRENKVLKFQIQCEETAVLQICSNTQHVKRKKPENACAVAFEHLVQRVVPITNGHGTLSQPTHHVFVYCNTPP